MSGQATGWVLRHGPRPEMVDRTGTPYGQRARGYRAVLVCVADAANRDGAHAHPGYHAIEEGALYARRQVNNILTELVAEGWLEVEERGGGRGRATVYRLPKMAEENGAMVAPSDESIPRNADPEKAQSEADTAQSRVHPNGLATGEQRKDPSSSATPPPRRLVELPDGTAVRLGWSPPASAVDRLASSIVLCDELAEQLRRRGDHVDGRSTSRKWVLDMEALLRIDGREEDAVRRVIRWLDAGQDEVSSFWRAHVRSPGKLRAKWTQMSEAWEAHKLRAARGTRPQPAISEEAARIVERQYAEANGAGLGEPGVLEAGEAS